MGSSGWGISGRSRIAFLGMLQGAAEEFAEKLDWRYLTG